jgi:hypothetical protein
MIYPVDDRGQFELFPMPASSATPPSGAFAEPAVNPVVNHPDQLEIDLNEASLPKLGFFQQLQNPTVRSAANQKLIADIQAQIATLQENQNLMTSLRVKELQARLWALKLEKTGITALGLKKV